MIEVLWFFGKTFLAIFPFILFLALISLVFGSIAVALNNINKSFVMIYYMIVSVFYLYFYGFLGAYYKELYEYYSAPFANGWILYIFCLMASFSCIKYFNSEVVIARNKLNNGNRDIFGNIEMKSNLKFTNDEIASIATIHTFRGSWMIFVSFILFSFLPSLITKVYGHIPDELAKLFT